ncbi:MAG: GNAT family N-acetyltransferase [Phenylobacterium sp.]|uniref:GNAT family N-acetyltransferase n=1 Tax=Phenylobacterium sp. TaxID=1871053 RepID=UPI0027358BF4|nr:GNAT family N-acetyltransferase [Phenylobacterium sp.]MDP1643733.1 GNAT family N-acetyltransferase [Phenylobacterium sp.]MDP3118431.1 GNAT family N-acetyltransferase [Phenylobacterium sp.]
MSAPKYLIDTNVFIGLEDHAEVAPVFASLQQLAARYGVGICVHAASVDDIERDRNIARRRVSLSKIQKFPVIARVIGLDDAVLEARYGALRKPNDVVDATLLHALDIGVVDFLVTEDQGLHDRALKASAALASRVLHVADAVSLLRTTYATVNVNLPAVREVDAHTIPLDDPIFATLRADYPPFDTWWREKCVRPMRKCWVVIDDTCIAGLVVRKDETRSDTDASLAGNKVLKVCTFKVRPESRGVKLGELLLKQVLWYARTNKHDVVYLTTYPGQTTLIGLLEYYGFIHTYDKANGERVYEKPLLRERLVAKGGDSLFDLARLNYPRFATGSGVKAYAIPIKEEFHRVLFPELFEQPQLSLFPTSADIGLHRPGNTIRKVYLCRAQARIDQPGALLFFYKGKAALPPSQAITTVGVFEDMALAHSNDELRRMAGGRSVYTDAQLTAMGATAHRPVKVINFLLAGHFEPPVGLAALVRDKVFAGHPPQSIKHLESDQLASVLGQVDLGFAV